MNQPQRQEVFTAGPVPQNVAPSLAGHSRFYWRLQIANLPEMLLAGIQNKRIQETMALLEIAFTDVAHDFRSDNEFPACRLDWRRLAFVHILRAAASLKCRSCR